MKKTVLSLLLAGAIALTACGGSVPADTKDAKSHFYAYDCETGATYSTMTGYNQKTYFLDFASMKVSPLCAVPNCNHNGADCLSRAAEYPVIYDGDMYFFHSEYGIEETKKGREFKMDSEFKKAALDNSEIQTMCEFTDAIPRNEDTMVICGHKLYFIAYDPDVEIDAYGGSTVKSGGGHDFLCSVDLGTFEYRNYGSICYVEDEYPAADNSSSAHISGISGGKIYISYEFMKEFADPQNDIVHEWTYYSFVFDTETEQYSESELPAAMYADDELYCWLDDKGDKLHVIVGGTDTALDYANYSNTAQHFGNRLFVAGAWVDLTDMTVHYLSDEYRNYSAVAFFDGDYIMREGNTTFVKLTEDELLALEK